MRHRDWDVLDPEDPVDDQNRRHAARIGCQFALLLRGTWTHVAAAVDDISRDGARLTLDIRELGLEASSGLNEIARQLRHLLTADVVAHFQPQLLGSLVTRRVRPVRLARLERDEPRVEIGCSFEEPLVRAEIAALGLPIPMRGETEEEARQREPAVPPQVRRVELAPGIPACGLTEQEAERDLTRIRVTATERENVPSFVAYAEQVDDAWIDVFVPNRRVLELPTELPDVRAAAEALSEIWGEHVLIGSARDGEDRWSARADLDRVDLLPLDPDAMRIRYRFVGNLDEDEVSLLRLGG